MTREIPLTRGFVAVVDDEDYELASGIKWHASTSHGTTYAVNSNRHRTPKTVRLHHVVLGVCPPTKVDHIDGNGINCRRRNLRVATDGQNMANARKRRDGLSSRYKGVTLARDSNSWQAQLQVNYKRPYLGQFQSEESAARAYDAAARVAFGRFAALNFPEKGERSALTSEVIS